MTIAQTLLKQWKATTMPLEDYLLLANDPNVITPIRTPLTYYMEYVYKNYYCNLCRVLNTTPLSYGKWLCTII